MGLPPLGGSLYIEEYMSAEIFQYANLAGFIAVIAFLWGLHRDLANVRERLAKLEGAVDVLTRLLMDRERGGVSAAE